MLLHRKPRHDNFLLRGNINVNFKHRLQRGVAPARPNTNRPRNGRSGGKDADLPAEVIHSPFQYSGMVGTQVGVRREKWKLGVSSAFLCLPRSFYGATSASLR